MSNHSAEPRESILAKAAVLIAIVAMFSALFAAGFVAVGNDIAALEARIRTIEQVKHAHDAQHRALYPPVWIPRTGRAAEPDPYRGP